jgi:ATP-dependent helicase IRC3
MVCMILATNIPADETTESLEKLGADSITDSDHIPQPRSVTYRDYDDPFSLLGHTSGAPHIAQESRHAWVSCGGDVYVLECLGKGYVRIEPIKGGYGLSFLNSAHGQPYR